MCDVDFDIIYEMANDSLFVILLLCMCYVIVLVKRLDALLSILGASFPKSESTAS